MVLFNEYTLMLLLALGGSPEHGSPRWIGTLADQHRAASARLSEAPRGSSEAAYIRQEMWALQDKMHDYAERMDAHLIPPDVREMLRYPRI